MNTYLSAAILLTALILTGFNPTDLVDSVTSATAQYHSKIEAVTNAAWAPTAAVHLGN